MFGQIHKMLDETQWHLTMVFVHDRLVIQGWMFVVEFEGQHYLLLNAADLSKELNGKPLNQAFEVEPRIFDRPFSTDEHEISKIMRGVFVWTKKTGG